MRFKLELMLQWGAGAEGGVSSAACPPAPARTLGGTTEMAAAGPGGREEGGLTPALQPRLSSWLALG